MFLPPPHRDPPPKKDHRRPLWRESIRLWAYRGPWHYAATITGVTLGVASVLPIWVEVYFSSWEANGDLATFWGMLFSLLFALITQPSPWQILTYFGWNAIVLAGLVATSLSVGRWLGRKAGR